MYKIRKITFIDHPMFKNLSLDFCDIEGNAVDTVIIAGENGTGKSTILNELYKVSNHKVDFQCEIEMEDSEDSIKVLKLKYYFNYIKQREKVIYIMDNKANNLYIAGADMLSKYPFAAIYSDVDINFHSNKVSSVTSFTLDSEKIVADLQMTFLLK